MPPTESFETDRLAELVAAKHGVLTHIRQLTRRQAEYIDSGDMTTLARIFAAKQTLLGQLRNLERQLDPFREQDPERRLWRTPEARRQCRELAERSASLLEEIKRVDLQDQQRLIERRDAAAIRLDSAHVAARARTAYVPDAPASSQLDITSSR